MIENFANFLVTLLGFCFTKTTRKAKFQSFLPLRKPLVATFNEKRAPTSRKYVAEQDIVMPNWLKTFRSFWSHSSVFPKEKQPEKINFESLFNSKRSLCGYCHCNACTYFKEICSLTRGTNAKLIKCISNFFVALVRFSSIKTIWKDKFSESFTTKKPFGGYFPNVCSYFKETCN